MSHGPIARGTRSALQLYYVQYNALLYASLWQKFNLIAIVHVNVKNHSLIRNFKRLLPVVLRMLPFARDAASAYKLNTSIVRLARLHKNRHNRYESSNRSHRIVKLYDYILTSKPRCGNEFVCEYMPWLRQQLDDSDCCPLLNIAYWLLV